MLFRSSDAKDFREPRHVQLLKPLAGALLMTEIAIHVQLFRVGLQFRSFEGLGEDIAQPLS